MAKGGKRGKRTKGGRSRRLSRSVGVLLTAALAAHAAFSVWFVHHPRKWVEQKRDALPAALFDPVYATGNRLGDLTDALGLTGHDVVYGYDTDAPAGAVVFAGDPVRIGAPAPGDIRTIDRGDFRIGWSPSLGHPVWCAYHVIRDAAYPALKRPNFSFDRAVPNAPKPADYAGTRYDRGHMAPNYAIVTRYGQAAQKRTFLTSNIAPQTPQLNRGAWRDLEHRIAEFWTARYGEIWVIVGCYTSGERPAETLPGSHVEVPENYYMVIVAQEGLDVRALAVDLPQTVDWGEYPARHIVAIDELERRTGLDFLADLPEFIESPLEAELPSRLWPVGLWDAFRLLFSHGDEY